MARVPNKIRRAEWSTELAARLNIEEALIREELRRAAAERRTEIKLRPEAAEALASGVKPAERRLLQILLENESIRADILKEMEDDAAHRGAGLEKVFAQVLTMARAGEPITAAGVAENLSESERRLVFELSFDESPEPSGSLEEARSCLTAMQRRRLEGELREVQRQIQQAEQAKDNAALRTLLARKQELRQSLAALH